LSYLRKKIDEYIIDETLIKIGSEYFWLWVIIEPKDKEILSITISKERSMLVAEKFLSKVVEKLRFPSGFIRRRHDVVSTSM
jgi:putative transposase